MEQNRFRLHGPGLDPANREAFFWICALILVNQIGFGIIVPVAPLYAESFGVSSTAIGLSIALYGLARFAVNLPAGQLADRRGRKTLLALGGIATMVGNVVCALAPNFLVFLLGRFVSGAGAAMVLAGSQTVIADISTVDNRGRLMSLYQGVFLFAVGFGPVPGGILAAKAGLAAPFAVNAALAGLVTLLAMFRLPETRPVMAVGIARPTMTMMGQLRLLKTIPGFALVGFVSFALFFSRTGGLFNVLPIDASNRLHLGPDQIGLALGAVSILGLLLAYPSGVIVDRFGRKAAIVPATILSGGSMMAFSFIGDWTGFLVSCVIWAAATAIGSSAPAAYAADLAPPGIVASALGAYRLVADSGYVLGPLILGAISDYASPVAAYRVAAVLTLIAGTAFALKAPETVHRRTRTIPASAPEPS